MPALALAGMKNDWKRPALKQLAAPLFGMRKVLILQRHARVANANAIAHHERTEQK